MLWRIETHPSSTVRGEFNNCTHNWRLTIRGVLAVVGVFSCTEQHSLLHTLLDLTNDKLIYVPNETTSQEVLNVYFTFKIGHSKQKIGLQSHD